MRRLGLYVEEIKSMLPLSRRFVLSKIGQTVLHFDNDELR